MSIPGKTTGLTYRALWDLFPEYDKVIRDIIDGELFETPSPGFRHGRVVVRLVGALYPYAKEHGGEGFPPLTGVYLDDRNFVEPDVTFILAQHASKIENEFIRGAPDLVVEISSPETRERDATTKRELYERFGVPEYWIVDLVTDGIAVNRLVGGRFDGPTILRRGDQLESYALSGFSVSVDELLGPPGE